MIAALLGSAAALHPFASTDPTIAVLDRFICPFYALTPLLPKLSDPLFFAVAFGSNVILYCVIAWKATTMIGAGRIRANDPRKASDI